MTDVLDWQKNKYLGSAPEKITYLSKTNKSKRSVGKHKNVCFSTSLSTPFWYFAVCALKYTLLDKRWQNSPKQSRAVYTLLWWGYSVNPSPAPERSPNWVSSLPKSFFFFPISEEKVLLVCIWCDLCHILSQPLAPWRWLQGLVLKSGRKRDRVTCSIANSCYPCSFRYLLRPSSQPHSPWSSSSPTSLPRWGLLHDSPQLPVTFCHQLLRTAAAFQFLGF